jgi:hypothetical protein
MKKDSLSNELGQHHVSMLTYKMTCEAPISKMNASDRDTPSLSILLNLPSRGVSTQRSIYVKKAQMRKVRLGSGKNVARPCHGG